MASIENKRSFRVPLVRPPDQLHEAWEVEERKTKALQSLDRSAKQSWQHQSKPYSHRGRDAELGLEVTLGGLTQVKEHSGLNLS